MPSAASSTSRFLIRDGTIPDTERAVRRIRMTLNIQPLTPGRWDDFVNLFGRNGACAGCWCMWWRLPRAHWVKRKGGANKKAIRKLVTEGNFPGILAYADGQPVGWCAIGPRE